MLRYTVKLSKDTNGTLLVDVPAIPEAHTFGADREEALARAGDAIATALSLYIENHRDIPAGATPGGRAAFVTLSALTEAKLALYTELRAQRISKTGFARRLGCHLPQVDRLLDLNHASRLDQLEAAFRELGKRLVVEIREAA